MANKKKKASLKPVARGFATTSVPKKVVPVEEDLDVAPSVASSVDEEAAKAENGSVSSGATPAPPPSDEFDPDKVEEQSLQNLVDRLQTITEKDIVRTVKVRMTHFLWTFYAYALVRLLRRIEDSQRHSRT